MRIKYESCPLCASTDLKAGPTGICSGHKLYDARLGPVIEWVDCVACGHQFSSGYFGLGDMDILYSRAHDNQKAGHDPEGMRIINGHIVERVAWYKKSGSWLDVGFGDGSLAATAAEWGYIAHGIDPRARTIEAACGLPFTAWLGTFDDYSVVPGEFGVVSMADVLEHMPFPKAALMKANEALSPDGVLFLSCPNKDSHIWKLLGDRNPYLGEIEHFHNLGRQRLYELLGECGFYPVRFSISERYRIGMQIVARKY